MQAHEVANELRRIAKALDNAAELEIAPYLSINAASDTKEDFLTLARIMPRPMKKGVDFPHTDYSDFKLEHSFWRIKVSQSKVCTIVKPAQPAQYECPSILSDEEEAELVSAE